jgi:beta-galactosidase/beta-glucuronidase
VEAAKPEHYEETILVPFPPQSLLSGIHRNIPEEQYLFYRRKFRLSENLWPEGVIDFQTHRIILHIGAVDQLATVWVDGTMVGEHAGGYEHFSLDITDVLKNSNGVDQDLYAEHELVIRAMDQLSNYVFPYGKQTNQRGGMWYTPVSGIWQSVWLEVVPQKYIGGLNIKNGLDWGRFLQMSSMQQVVKPALRLEL